MTPGAPEPWEGIEVYCECGHLFRAPRSLAGGITNCPACAQVVSVPGGAEPLFWVLVSLGAFGVLALAVVAFYFLGPVAGGVVLVVGALVIGVAVLAS